MQDKDRPNQPGQPRQGSGGGNPNPNPNPQPKNPGGSGDR